MALRKTVRKARKSPKYGRKRYAKHRFPMTKRMSTNVHKFTRFELSDAGSIRKLSCNFGVSGVNAYAMTFELNRLTNYTEFTALYDQYKITGVKVYFDYSTDTAPVSDPHVAIPKIWAVRDYDDATTPTIDDMTQSTRVKVIRPFPNKTYSMFLRPAVLNQVYKSVVSTGNVPKWGQWIDCNDSSVPHYGLKLVAQGVPSTNFGAVSLRCKYYVTFKGVV